MRGDARAIEKLFAALDRLEPETVDQLWALVGELGHRRPRSAPSRRWPGCRPSAARRLIALADQPVLQKLIGIR